MLPIYGCKWEVLWVLHAYSFSVYQGFIRYTTVVSITVGQTHTNAHPHTPTHTPTHTTSIVNTHTNTHARGRPPSRSRCALRLKPIYRWWDVELVHKRRHSWAVVAVAAVLWGEHERLLLRRVRRGPRRWSEGSIEGIERAVYNGRTRAGLEERGQWRVEEHSLCIMGDLVGIMGEYGRFW